jgi:ribosomal protein S18 acetylase RimI-like enzyme
MTEQEKDGSHLTANLPNLYRCLDLFEAYTTGSLFGICVLCQPDPEKEPVGIALGGELAVRDEYDTDMGRIATIWGVYVEPSHRGSGVGVKLFAKALELAIEMGFDSLETYVRDNNIYAQKLAETCGAEPYMRQYIASLRDPKMFKNDRAQDALAREVSNG